MRPIFWSPAATRDVRRIHEHLAKFNPAAAARIVAELYSSTDILRRFPELGKLAAAGTRERFVGKRVVVYRTTPTETRILRVWHGIGQNRGRPFLCSKSAHLDDPLNLDRS